MGVGVEVDDAVSKEGENGIGESYILSSICMVFMLCAEPIPKPKNKDTSEGMLGVLECVPPFVAFVRVLEIQLYG